MSARADLNSEHAAVLPGMIPTQIVRFAEQSGYPLPPLLADLPQDLPHYARLGRRASWHEVTTLLERLYAAHPGSMAGYAEHYVTAVPFIQFMATYTLTTHGVFRLHSYAWQRVWPMAGFSAKRVDDRWHLSARIRRDFSGSRAFLELVTQILPRLPTLRGKPRCEVHAAIGDAWDGDWEIFTGLPEVHSQEPTPEEIYESAQREVFGDPRRRPHIPTAWNLTPAERRVVEALAAGLGVAEIANHLSVGRETVRTHLKRAMQKADVRRQAELVAKLYADRSRG